MAFEVSSPKLDEIKQKLINFCEKEVLPANRIWEQKLVENAKKHDGNRFAEIPSVLDELKKKAKSLGLWNLWMPKSYLPLGAGLTNLEYAQLAEIMGRYGQLASEACNCSAPDTGNMEVFAKYGTSEQKEKWLVPLMNGEIRSAFLMTEPAVASSDATNITTRIDRVGNEYVINGVKWWSSGACDPRCKVLIVMGRSNWDEKASQHNRQSMIAIPMDAKGITVLRHLTVFGYDDAPEGHAEVLLKDVRVPLSCMLLGEGRGFEISQGRLGPGRVHHCMRTIGTCERAQELMIERCKTRIAFGKPLIQQGTIQADIARNRLDIDSARLLVLYCAAAMDKGGAKGARKEIAMIKIQIPQMACRVIDRCLQSFGGAGVSQDFPLAKMYAGIRTLRLADGPDEVHMRTLALLEAKSGGRSASAKL